MQTFDRITSCLYGTSVEKKFKTELLNVNKHLNIKWLTLMIIQMKIKQNII